MPKRSTHHRLVKRGDTWFAWGYDRHGERWRESTKQRDIVAAKRVQREIERRRAAEPDPVAAPDALNLAAALNDLDANDRRAAKSDHTLTQRDNHARHLCRVLGPTFDLRTATRADLERYVDARLGDEVVRHTIRKELATYRKAARLAGAWNREQWPDLGRDVYVARTRYLTVREYVKLRRALAPERRPYLDAFVFIGGRRAEMERITAADVDWKGRRVRIVESKRGAKVRWVPLAKRAAEALKSAPGANGKGPLLPPWGNARRDIAAACKRAGIAPVTWNDLRRTFQSWLAQGGADVLSVAKLAGTSVEMVERVYAQLGIDTLATAVARLPGGAYQGDPEQG